MSTYLHGWRRKAGCVALVLACLLAVGWMRSVEYNDVEKFVHHPKTVFLIGSTNYGIVWSSLQVVEENFQFPATARFGGKSGPHQKFSLNGMLFFWTLCQIFDEFEYGPDTSDEEIAKAGQVIESYCGYGGFHFAQVQMNLPPLFHVATWIIPYWSLVIPLTLVSTWLLLSKPRQNSEPPATSL